MRTLVGAVVLAGMLALSGCVDGDRIPTLPPTPTATPLFASEEEALAAAEDAYAAYLEVSNQIAIEGGANPERIAPYVTEDQLADELIASEYYSENQLRASTGGAVVGVELQQYVESGSQTEIVVYVCVDVTEARLLDSDGVDVTPPDRPSQVTLEVTLTSSASGPLLVADTQQWSSSVTCS